MERSDCEMTSSLSDDDLDYNSIASIEDEDEDEDTEVYSLDDGVADLNKKSKSSSPAIFWSGRSKKIPIFLFKADALGCNFTEHKSIANKYHMSFKQPKGDCKLVRTLLTCHGFKECEASSVNYNIIWTGSHVKPYFLSSMLKFQKVNHFPRSYEITRKDRLYKNIEMMQQNKGFKHFNFVPQTFVLPREYKAFSFHSNKEKCLWIVKPTSLSRGRGIFLTNSPEKALVDDNVVVCRYIDNPLLINGYKFDLRLYVLVTSFDPLIIYLYKEGLTRFATVQFNKSSKFMGDSCMHLTNYSINKHSSAYVSNNDASVEDRGSKWSLSGLLRFLRENHYDTTALMMSIEDVIIKTMISGEFAISAACKAFVPHRGNCFELFGFDILIDEKMKPWVLEVNLSPSLACDTPLDLKIKSNMISDLLSLVGLECQDPMLRKATNLVKNAYAVKNQRFLWWRKRLTYYQKRRLLTACSSNNLIKQLNNNLLNNNNNKIINSSKNYKTTDDSNDNINHNNNNSHVSPLKNNNNNNDTLSNNNNYKNNYNSTCNNSTNSNVFTNEEIHLLRRVREEHSRRGGWVRIFPTEVTWSKYHGFFHVAKPQNIFLHQNLFNDDKGILANENVHIAPSNLHNQMQSSLSLLNNRKRCMMYEKSLDNIKNSGNHSNERMIISSNNSNHNNSNSNNHSSSSKHNQEEQHTLVQTGKTSTNWYHKLLTSSSFSSESNINNSSSSNHTINRITSVPSVNEGFPGGDRLRSKVLRDLRNSMPIVNYMKYLLNLQVASFSKSQERNIFSEYLNKLKNALACKINKRRSFDEVDIINYHKMTQRFSQKMSEYYGYEAPLHKLHLSPSSLTDQMTTCISQINKFLTVFNSDTGRKNYNDESRDDDDDDDEDAYEDDDHDDNSNNKKYNHNNNNNSSNTNYKNNKRASSLLMKDFFEDADVSKGIKEASLLDLQELLSVYVKNDRQLDSLFGKVLPPAEANLSIRSQSAKMYPRLKELTRMRQTPSNTEIQQARQPRQSCLSAPISKRLPLSASSYKQALLVYGKNGCGQFDKRPNTSMNYVVSMKTADDETSTNLNVNNAKPRAYSSNPVGRCLKSSDQSQVSVDVSPVKTRHHHHHKNAGNNNDDDDEHEDWVLSGMSVAKNRQHRCQRRQAFKDCDDYEADEVGCSYDEEEEDYVNRRKLSGGKKSTFMNKSSAKRSAKYNKKRGNDCDDETIKHKDTNTKPKVVYNKNTFVYKHQKNRNNNDEDEDDVRKRNDEVKNDSDDCDDKHFNDDGNCSAAHDCTNKSKSKSSSYYSTTNWKVTVMKSKELVEKSKESQQELISYTRDLQIGGDDSDDDK